MIPQLQRDLDHVYPTGGETYNFGCELGLYLRDTSYSADTSKSLGLVLMLRSMYNS